MAYHSKDKKIIYIISFEGDKKKKKASFEVEKNGISFKGSKKKKIRHIISFEGGKNGISFEG
jgi:hypothetical protein